MAAARLSEESRRKIVEAASPGKPLVRSARRLEVDVVNSCLRQCVAEGFCSLSLDGTDSQKEDLHLLIKCGRFRKSAAASSLCIEAAAPAPAASAEAAQVRELIEVVQSRCKCLRTTHRQAGHRAVLASG